LKKNAEIKFSTAIAENIKKTFYFTLSAVHFETKREKNKTCQFSQIFEQK